MHISRRRRTLKRGSNNKTRGGKGSKTGKKWTTAISAASKTLKKTGSVSAAKKVLNRQALVNARKLFGSIGKL
ncbi:MAG: hypothetical protein MUP82_00110 [Candidatus Marinimicrobia bacterium]|nr:hypothetical protein [Candidatus Neomarinimicrobiota bacterium]